MTANHLLQCLPYRKMWSFFVSSAFADAVGRSQLSVRATKAARRSSSKRTQMMNTTKAVSDRQDGSKGRSIALVEVSTNGGKHQPYFVPRDQQNHDRKRRVVLRWIRLCDQLHGKHMTICTLIQPLCVVHFSCKCAMWLMSPPTCCKRSSPRLVASFVSLSASFSGMR